MVRAESELAGEVEALLAEAERLDAAEDAAYGPDRRGDELPVELARREGRLAAIRAAKAALEAEAAAKARAEAEAAAAEQGRDPDQVTQAGDAAEAAAVVPDRAQRSFTDPDARIMKTSDGSFHYCFNGQAVVDEKSQVVLAASLRQSPADCPALPDMLTELAESLTAAGIDGTPDTLLADAGYFSADNVQALTDAGIDPLLATGRLKHGEKPTAAPRGRIPKDLTPKQLMSRKLRTKKGRPPTPAARRSWNRSSARSTSPKAATSSGSAARSKVTSSGHSTWPATTSASSQDPDGPPTGWPPPKGQGNTPAVRQQPAPSPHLR